MPPTNSSTTRRRFLSRAATAGIAAANLAAGGAWSLPAAARATAAEPSHKPMDDLPIVDTHQHLWDLGKFRLPWTKDVPRLNRSFVISDYHKAAAGLNVVKTVYMEVDVDPAQQMAEAEYVTALCRDKHSGMAAAVISGRPGDEGFAKYIKPFKDNPAIKGVRQVLHVPSAKAGLCLEKPFVASIRLLGELGMSFDLCMRPTELGDAGKLVEACPDTRFILDHCGNQSPQAKDHSAWKREIAALARRKNVVCKVSGLVDKAAEDWKPEQLAPIINHALDEFGPDRVMFGGDWPVCTLRASLAEWVAALRTIVAGRKVGEQRKLFHDNAVAFYGLK
jgi:predicted TIM-barrel fold metal-dependent hydrolase